MTANMPHVPREPRTRDASGNKVDEPVQCAACLQAWPCEVKQLQDANAALKQRIARLDLELFEAKHGIDPTT